MNPERMRAQTEAYIEAVYAAHPELDNRVEVLFDFDPYPLILQAEAPSIQAVATSVARKNGLTLADLRGKSRQGKVMKTRIESMIACCTHCRESIAEIGRFHNRDHTTVLHHWKKHGGARA